MTKPTVNMFNEEGRRVIIEPGETQAIEEWRKAGFELEDKIREKLPEELKELPTEEVILILAGKAEPPKKEEDPPAETPPAEDPPKEEEAPPDATQEGKEAQDQAAGEVGVEPRPSKDKKDTKSTKSTKKK